MSSHLNNSTNASSYPRTGKRGVPQQFPRRLYEMLESETSHPSSPDNGTCIRRDRIIEWSKSGRAFRIWDVSLFASIVLPKYFRTSKFSSFQRNLNLYGFFKVRRGPDTDMYAHPAFVRGHPEILSHLRKCNSTTERKSSSGSIYNYLLVESPESLSSMSSNDKIKSIPTRTVSPSPPKTMYKKSSIIPKKQNVSSITVPQCPLQPWSCREQQQNIPKPSLNTAEIGSSDSQISQKTPGSDFHRGGKLALLAVALASMAERDFSEDRWNNKTILRAS